MACSRIQNRRLRKDRRGNPTARGTCARVAERRAAPLRIVTMVRRALAVTSRAPCIAICLACLAHAPTTAIAQTGVDAATVAPADVTPATTAAIAGGVRWLVANQRPDGGFASHGASGRNDGAMTALVTLALLADGHTPTRGRHWLTVRRAVDHMLRCAQPNGLLAPASESVPMFSHGFTMLTLAQVLGMEEDRQRQQRITAALHRAIELSARSQSRDGGWLYHPDQGGDEGSVTITQVQGLRACRDAGLTVPGGTIEHAVDYIHRSLNPDGGVRYRASDPGPSQPPITAAAVAVLHAAGRYDDPRIERMLGFAKRMLPVRVEHGHHLYAHRYLAQALWQCGGHDWAEYYPRMADWLVERQHRDGSWPGDHVGPVYGTAMSLIILQLPHALLPAHQR